MNVNTAYSSRHIREFLELDDDIRSELSVPETQLPQSQFQVRIVVTPLVGQEGGSSTSIDISSLTPNNAATTTAASRTASSAYSSAATASTVNVAELNLLPPINNHLPETQWISRRTYAAPQPLPPPPSQSSSTVGGHQQQQRTSRYHRNCVARRERIPNNNVSSSSSSQQNYPTAAGGRTKSIGAQIRRYELNGGIPSSYATTSNAGMPPHITGEMVEDFLRTHPDFLERYVIEELDYATLEKWIIRKAQLKHHQQAARNNNNAGSVSVGVVDGTTTSTTTSAKKNSTSSLSKWMFCVHADKRKMLQELTYSLQCKPTKDRVLWELAGCIASAVEADGFRLYLPERGNPENLLLYTGPDERSANTNHRREFDARIAKRVARTMSPVKMSRQTPPNSISSENEMCHILCLPIFETHNQLSAVLELWRRESMNAFYEEEEEIALSYLVWGGIALHYAELYNDMNQQIKLNDFLLEIVKSVFQDMISIETLIGNIMNFAQKLVDADRASLFRIDDTNKELYATIFDVGGAESPEREIRFPLGTGIAGQVALTGEILNITDAYSDRRFNKRIDQMTGYKTSTILCMPIYRNKGSIIGVMQMVNKNFGVFTKEDEKAFEMFAVYCGLALHHAELYDTAKKSEQKYKVALEVLSYHNTCTEEEIDEAHKIQLHVDPAAVVDDYYFNPFQLKDLEKVQFAIHMFTDLFGLARFDKNSLLRFVLTVRKNYRRVPYHNWTHGFSVAHTMYTILKHSPKVFKEHECLAMYVGALCHDLDHRGKNNKFMLDTESPLAAMYSTSTMEHHHFNQTVTILQQDGHNIFSKLSSEEYKKVLDLLKHCILATDLALFFTKKARINDVITANSFAWTNPDHRLLIQALAMTGSDLAASAKPWDIQVKTIQIIFQEFYDQGDAERAAGRTPIPMMDRNMSDEQPASQVGFLMGIATPCYVLLNRFLPGTKPLLDMCEENLAKWQRIDKEKDRKAWNNT